MFFIRFVDYTIKSFYKAMNYILKNLIFVQMSIFIYANVSLQKEKIIEEKKKDFVPTHEWQIVQEGLYIYLI